MPRHVAQKGRHLRFRALSDTALRSVRNDICGSTCRYAWWYIHTYGVVHTTAAPPLFLPNLSTRYLTLENPCAPTNQGSRNPIEFPIGPKDVHVSCLLPTQVWNCQPVAHFLAVYQIRLQACEHVAPMETGCSLPDAVAVHGRRHGATAVERGISRPTHRDASAGCRDESNERRPNEAAGNGAPARPKEKNAAETKQNGLSVDTGLWRGSSPSRRACSAVGRVDTGRRKRAGEHHHAVFGAQRDERLQIHRVARRKF